MKKMIGIAIAGALILCGCHAMDGDDMINTNTEIFTSEKQSESSSGTTFASEETALPAAENVTGFHDDSIITLTDEQADCSMFWYAHRLTE